MAGSPIDTPRAAAYPEFRDGTEACAKTDPAKFFNHQSAVEAEPAKRVCRECDLRGKCLEWALATDQRFGVWGATTPQERRRILKERGQQ
jgi:WhiB family transcriptional regulator, redox-sensing transcriptional regulator